jgi:hypothetical protein
MFLGCRTSGVNRYNESNITSSGIIIPKLCITNDKISKDWHNSLTTRMTKEKLDSISILKRKITNEEKEWAKLIGSKTIKWNTFKDSLEIPFRDCSLDDTLYIFMGYSGVDDAFSYRNNTVCFDLTALQINFGSATLPENDDRIDRLFSHELTHLIHKEWALKNKLILRTFKDCVLWECMYEGMGMYRSLSKKWLPQKGILPEITKNTIAALSPIFVDRLIDIESSAFLSENEKNRILANLSSGTVPKKWGAFTIAIWLALEANEDDRNLIYWIDNGLNSVILLAQKYLTGSNKSKFENVFAKKPDG